MHTHIRAVIRRTIIISSPAFSRRMPIQTRKLKNCGVLDEDEAAKVTKVWYYSSI